MLSILVDDAVLDDGAVLSGLSILDDDTVLSVVGVLGAVPTVV